MPEKCKYHKRNVFPGGRVAEKKRVAERKEESDKKADARGSRIDYIWDD
ncbi:MAG: hypothetical protein ACOCZQ_00520 [Nanoarchaeota archaeon]